MVIPRVGFGYDVHPLVEGKKLILGGIEIPYPKGLDGHSDADVLLHAICDALLGASNLRDIGYHFPNSDPEYKDVDSKKLLRLTGQKIKTIGFQIGNIDSTLIAEEPYISSYIPMMQNKIAEALEISISNVSIKATTNEKLGFVGNKEGLVAMAVALIYEIKE